MASILRGLCDTGLLPPPQDYPIKLYRVQGGKRPYLEPVRV